MLFKPSHFTIADKKSLLDLILPRFDKKPYTAFEGERDR